MIFSTNYEENCEAQHESCETNDACFKELKTDRLPITAGFHSIGATSESPKLCYDTYSNVQLKVVGGSIESEIWPWMYQIKGKNSDGEFFCSANQIGRHLLVTGKM